METRKEELSQLQTQIAEIDAEFSKILKHLQWDRKHLLEDVPKVICKYNDNHRVSQDSIEGHEVQCRLSHNSYSNEDKMLPDPFDKNAKTLIRLSKDDIKEIITQAANADPSFKKVFNKSYLMQHSKLLILENVDIEPQTLDRLQSTYTGDERRAIYDVVVQAAPFCHDLSDLALPSEQGQGDSSKKQKSRLEILAELRDMKRRRTKYRVAAKTRNYSDVLRDVIKTQMEVYSDVKIEKSEASISNDKWKDVITLEINKPHRPSRNDAFRPTSEYNDNTYKHKREKSRTLYDDDKPSTSKKSRHYDETDSYSKYKNYQDRRYYGDVKKEKDIHSSRDSSRYDERCNSKNIKDRPKEQRNYKGYEDRSAKESKQYERSYVEKHRREKHSSSRGHREDQYDSKRCYGSYEYESRKDKKKYTEYKKLLQ